MAGIIDNRDELLVARTEPCEDKVTQENYNEPQTTPAN